MRHGSGDFEVRSYEVAHTHGLWHADFHHGSHKVLTAEGSWKTPLLLGFIDAQRRTDGTLSLLGRRFEVPSRFRHLERLHLRYAGWDLSHVDLVDEPTGEILGALYPLDKRHNASGRRRRIARRRPRPLSQRLRMCYHAFRAMGLFVGSGAIEAGCKTVVGQRLKHSGMRWTVAGAHAVIALRCNLLSNRWDDFWNKRATG